MPTVTTFPQDGAEYLHLHHIITPSTSRRCERLVATSMGGTFG